jgi:tRNA (guanine-N7-)-methyltransferase
LGAHRPGAGPARRLGPLTAPFSPRLYGRTRGHALRPRQAWLLQHLLPRLRADPADPFAGWEGERWLEVGSGGGEHALAQVVAHPQAMLVACEPFQNGMGSLLSRLAPEGTDPALPRNLRLWDGDARLLLAALPDGSLDRLFLLFPDPWPKARHAKRRFVHPDALAGIARVLRPGAEWRIASDDPTYQAWVRATLAGSQFTAPEPEATRPQDWPPTRYETKALLAGRQPLYWSVRRPA